MAAENIRPLDPEIRQWLPVADFTRIVGADSDDFEDRPVTTRDPIFLVDVARGSKTVTVGVLVRCSGSKYPAVASVFDAEPLRDLILSTCE